MTAVKGLMDIASGQSVTTQVFNKRGHALGLAVYIPSGIQGVLGIRVCDSEGGTFDRMYDDLGSLIQIDPASYTLPAWVVIKASIMPAHFIKFQTFTDVTEATPQTQSAARQLRVMGTS